MPVVCSNTFPKLIPIGNTIRKVYADLSSFYQIAEGEGQGFTFDFHIERFCRVFHHHPAHLIGALELLTRAGYIHFSTEDENSSRVMFLVTRDELYGVGDLTPADDLLLSAMMRTLGVFFADYITIREDELAEVCHTTPQLIYTNSCSVSHVIAFSITFLIRLVRKSPTSIVVLTNVTSKYLAIFTKCVATSVSSACRR